MLCNEAVGVGEEHSAQPAQPSLPWDSPMGAWPLGESSAKSMGGKTRAPFGRDREFEVAEVRFIKGGAGETGQDVH